MNNEKQQVHFIIIGVLLAIFFFSCSNESFDEEKYELLLDDIIYLKPVDSLFFDFDSETRDLVNYYDNNYVENRYGYHLFVDSNEIFNYVSIDSYNRLHIFNFKTYVHSYSEPICNCNIDAYKIDSEYLYVLCDSIFYIKDYNLKTLDYFSYKTPYLEEINSIDFSVENESNLYKINEYFVVMYYVVNEIEDGSKLYSNTNKLFYFFNRDTSFFASEGCKEHLSSFHYFRFPAVASDGEYLYHTHRVMNCISKSNEIATIINAEIEENDNYLSLEFSDQYEMSKLKKYRYSTDYNRNLYFSNEFVYLIKEIPVKIYYEDDIRKYELALKVIKFDKELTKIHTAYISERIYSFAYISDEKLFLFNIDNKVIA